MTRIAPHVTGHARARNGILLRVDYDRGLGWVATQYDLSMRVIEQIRGFDEDVHRVADNWAQGLEMPW